MMPQSNGRNDRTSGGTYLFSLLTFLLPIPSQYLGAEGIRVRHSGAVQHPAPRHNQQREAHSQGIFFFLLNTLCVSISMPNACTQDTSLCTIPVPRLTRDQVTVTILDIKEARFKYRSVPKLRPHAFLTVTFPAPVTPVALDVYLWQWPQIALSWTCVI
jgi:hypothetical protein